MTSVKELAYAKINLYLDVLARREDGFHDVRTVMHSVSLCDEVTVSVKPSLQRSVKIILAGNSRLPVDSRNLAYRAAELFLDATLGSAEVVIRLNKRIPVAAGLAGGSSDAAAVLRALNRIYKRPLTEKRLLSLAADLGSDVPYCLIGGSALCHGRGEQITRLPERLSLHTVVAVGDEHVSTPEAYAELDRIYADFTAHRDDGAADCLDSLLRSLESGVLSGHELFNVFERAVLPACQCATNIKRVLSDLGATHVLMSGSGPSVFGIFDSREHAERAANLLTEQGIKAYYAHTV